MEGGPLPHNGWTNYVSINSAAFHQSKHLETDEIFPSVNHCPVCLSKEARDPVYLLQRGPDIALLYCKSCGAASASHMPKDYVLDNYYNSYYDQNSSKITFSGLSRFATNILKSINISYLPTELNILDFGGGNGSLSIALSKMIIEKKQNAKVKITLIDYQNPIKIELKNIVVEYKKNINEIECKYDIVLASAIFEHIPELNDVIVKIFKAIKKEGYLYTRTPYMLPLTSLSKSLDLTYPAHVHDLGSQFWDRAIETFQLNAEIIQSRPSIVETRFKDNFFRTLIAYCLKAPGHLEGLLKGKRKVRHWHLVGGWEAVFKFK